MIDRYLDVFVECFATYDAPPDTNPGATYIHLPRTSAGVSLLLLEQGSNTTDR